MINKREENIDNYVSYIIKLPKYIEVDKCKINYSKDNVNKIIFERINNESKEVLVTLYLYIFQ